MSEQQYASFNDNITAFNAFMGTMTNVMNKTKNISYIPNKNLTTIAGITNCEVLGVLGHPVSVQGHTHDIDDVVMSYEEEEEVNGETTTVTKTKPLSELFDEKASSSHTHTTSDLTNWNTATWYFARTNYGNTFSNDQTINGTLTLNYPGQVLKMLNTTNNTEMTILLGKSLSNNDCAVMRYMNADKYLGLGFYGNLDILKITQDKTVTIASGGKLSTPAITLNGSDLATTLSGKASSSHTHDGTYAKLNSNNTFTGIQNFSDQINHLNNQSSYMSYFIGSSQLPNQCGKIAWYPGSGTPYMTINLYNSDGLMIYSNKLSTALPIESSSTITGTNVLANNETRLAACESGLSGKASSSHTHAISDVTDLQTTLNNLYSGNYKVGDESYYGIVRNSSAQTYCDVLGAKAPCELHIWVDNTSRWLNLPTPGFLNAIQGAGTRAVYSCYGYNGDIYTGATSEGVFDGTWRRLPRCDTSNSFTASQSISAGDDYLFQLFPSYTDTWIRPFCIWNGGMSVGQTMIMLIGVANSQRNNGWMGFNYQGWKSYENHLTFGLANADHLFLIYPYKAVFNVPVYIPTLYLNGTDLATTLSTVIRTDAANTFTATQTIIDTLVLQGDTTDTTRRGSIMFSIDNNAPSNDGIMISSKGGNALAVYYDRIFTWLPFIQYASADYPLSIIYPTYSSSWIVASRILASSMPSGGTILSVFGQSESNKNEGYIGFHYSGNNSSANCITLGMHSADHLVRIYPGVTEFKNSVMIQDTQITNQGGYTGNEWLIAGYNATAKCGYVGINTIGWGQAEFVRMNEYQGTIVAGCTCTSFTNAQGYNNNALTVNGKTEIDSTNPSNAFGANLQAAILNLVYPVGCIQFGWYPSVGSWTSKGVVYTSGGGMQTGFTVYQRTA